jgi:lysophospholipid acyltransferase (LPLAT)-like uncharacterized protein
MTLARALWRAAEWPVGLALWAATRLVLATARVRFQDPAEGRPAIYVHWHRYLPLAMPLCGARGGCILMSASPRMAPIARWARLVGLGLVRGASGENGRDALPRLAARLASGEGVELAVDGPAGPLYQARRGCAELALATGAPLVALAYDSPLAFTTPLRWDRQRLVLPFARVEVAARLVPRHADDTAEALLARVQATLDALEREA